MRKEIKKQVKGNRGITLIALVVTIVVLLILAGITISTLFGDNGIISAARKAAEDTKQDEINTEQGIKDLTDKMNEQLPGGSSGIKASQIAAEPTKYYGQKVNYVAGSETFQNELGIDWKIFYADNDHIYLIASDYVPVNKLPYSTDASGNITTNKPTNDNSSRPKAMSFGDSSARTGILSDYSGSARVPDNVKYLNKSYFDYLTTNNASSTNENMKAVAYMLDTKAWETYKDSLGKSDFVIGEPTIEILFNSYCQKNNLVNSSGANKYQVRVTSSTGYEISSDYGINWNIYSSENLSISDPLYVINSTTNASGMYVASPSANAYDIVMYVYYTGMVDSNFNTLYGDFGFRPLIALKSNVGLEEQADGSFNIK